MNRNSKLHLLKQIVALCGAVFLSLPLSAQHSEVAGDVLSMASPKLKKLVADYPAAAKVLTNSFAEVFPGKRVQLYYFYTDDESKPRAFHSYPDATGISISIRENQHPWDEFITLLFEGINTKGEKQFGKLCQEAKAGAISRTDFAKGILRIEFEAMKTTRDLVAGLKPAEKEKAESHYYKKVVECPGSFDDFLSITKNGSSKRDVIKHYELQYDYLRNTP